MKIVQAYATKNRCYQVAAPLTPRSIMLHSIGCLQLNASVMAQITISTDPTVTSGSVYTFTTSNNNKGCKNNGLYGSE